MKTKKQKYEIEMLIKCKTEAFKDEKGNLIISLPQYPDKVRVQIRD